MAAGEGRLFSFVVPAGTVRERLDRFLGEALREQDVSREKVKRAIKDSACSVDGAVCTDVAARIDAGQHLALRLRSEPTSVQAEEGALEIVYQDAFLVVLNKPAGLTVHPAPSCPDGTLVHRLVAHFPTLRAQEGFRPGIVHRLDKDTSGLICVALTEEARLRLSEAFAAREIHKEYLALVHGVPAPHGTVDAPLGRHPTIKVKVAVVKNGKPALSEWRVLYAGAGYALLAVRIHTGRTHQIRVHMAHIGHPLWGDAVYGSGDVGGKPRCGGLQGARGTPSETPCVLDPAHRQMLHAWRLSFTHPFTGQELTFRCPPPEDFVRTALCLEKKMQRVVVTGVAGCGKSAFMRTLEARGVPTWSADAAVIRLYEPGQEAWSVLLQRYGDRFVPDETSPVDRKALAAALLPQGDHTATPNTEEREPARIDIRELEALLHPLVLHDLEQFWQQCEKEGRGFAVAEVPLWFESGACRESGGTPQGNTKAVRNGGGRVTSPETDTVARHRPLVVGVFCEEAERQRRLLEVRGWSQDCMAHMDSLQWSQERKMAACDEVLANSGTPEELEAKTDAFIQHMSERAVADRAAFLQLWGKLVESDAPEETSAEKHTF